MIIVVRPSFALSSASCTIFSLVLSEKRHIYVKPIRSRENQTYQERMSLHPEEESSDFEPMHVQ